MNLTDMRYVLSKAYPGLGWKKKVAAMPDDQVIAVYYRITTGKSAGVRGNGKSTSAVEVFKNVTNALVELSEQQHKRKPYDFEEDGPRQLTFEDIM